MCKTLEEINPTLKLANTQQHVINVFPAAYVHFSPKHLEEILFSAMVFHESPLSAIFLSSFFFLF